MAALPTVSSAQDTKLDFKDVLIRPKRSTNTASPGPTTVIAVEA